MSGISLTASMRSNLLSLQNIASQQDIVQNRLATGLKVSSAIDNPSSYYTASSLNNRAADLTTLLDAMSQGIQTIKAASEAIESGTKFLEQAKAVANQALETSENIIAKVSTADELLAAVNSGAQGLILIDGEINIDSSQIILHDGQSLVGNQYFGSDKISRLNLTNNLEGGAIQLGNNSMVSDLEINFTAQKGKQFILVADGVTNTEVCNLNLNFNNPTVYGSHRAIQTINRGQIKLDGYFNSTAQGFSTRFLSAHTNSSVTIASGSIINHSAEGSTIRGIEFGGNAFLKIEKGSIINFDLKGAASSSFLGIAMSGASADIDSAEINIRLNSTDSNAQGLSVKGQNCSFAIRGNSKINIESDSFSCLGITASSEAKFDIKDQSQINIKNKHNNGTALYCVDTGIINITSNVKLNIISDTLIAFKTTAGQQSSANFAQGAEISWRNTDKSAQGIWLAQNNQQIISNTTETINGFDGKPGFNQTSATAREIADLPTELESEIKTKKTSSVTYDYRQYNQILDQYDDLISDASYKGINLLNSQRLKINFNEDRSSGIEILGVSALSADLGIVTTEWQSKADIEKSVSELEEAINTLRGYASQYGNYYSIVTTRQDFTENLINVLEEGADKLTLADMNQESANMLALQTSQQLAVNSLSLASQASQAVLRLF